MPVLQTADDGFRLDGEPFRIISGALHYFRVHPAHWADRLRKARLMGLNCVETYIPWNLHQPEPGRFALDGALDLPAFLDQAAAEGLHALLRPGPYICAEWEGGGLPSWLLADPGMRPRSTHPGFLAAVEAYFDALLPHVLPRLSTRGGPVLAVQVENEYGAYGQDADYLSRLTGMLRERHVDVPLFTSDQPQDLECGGLPELLRTANFGGRVTANLATLREAQPTGPLMCAEFWIGWFDHWGGTHTVRDPAHAAADLDELLTAGASVNLYMFHGGTNHGFTNGANDKHTYRPVLTSYDYDAPLDEAGDPTPKYAAFREVIARHAPVPDEPPPAPASKLSLPGITLDHSAPLTAHPDALAAPVTAEQPLAMEDLGQSFGFLLYETTLPHAGPALLHFTRVHDRAQLFLDGLPAGVLERQHHDHTQVVRVPRPGAVLRVLVENQGRVDYGARLPDRKGLLGPVTCDAVPLTGWRHRPLPLRSLTGVDFRPTAGPHLGPAFHRGTFDIPGPRDTFLSARGWTKGNAWINGFHLGRYWARGPQHTLYVPGPVLRAGRNELVLLELHAPAPGTSVDLVDTADLGPVE